MPAHEFQFTVIDSIYPEARGYPHVRYPISTLPFYAKLTLYITVTNPLDHHVIPYPCPPRSRPDPRLRRQISDGAGW